jgi:hypothetical protein
MALQPRRAARTEKNRCSPAAWTATTRTRRGPTRSISGATATRRGGRRSTSCGRSCAGRGPAFAIADNRTGELAEWDAEELRKQLDEPEAAGIDVEAELAFTDAEINALVKDGEAAAKGAGGGKGHCRRGRVRGDDRRPTSSGASILNNRHGPNSRRG